MSATHIPQYKNCFGVYLYFVVATQRIRISLSRIQARENICEEDNACVCIGCLRKEEGAKEER